MQLWKVTRTTKDGRKSSRTYKWVVLAKDSADAVEVIKREEPSAGQLLPGEVVIGNEWNVVPAEFSAYSIH